MKKFLFAMIVIPNVFSLIYSMDVDPLESLRAAQQEVMIIAQDAPTEVIKKINYWQKIIANAPLTPEMGITLHELVELKLLPRVVLETDEDIRQYVFNCIVEGKHAELQSVLNLLNNQTIDLKIACTANDGLVLAAMIFCSNEKQPLRYDHRERDKERYKFFDNQFMEYTESLPECSWKWALYFIKGFMDPDGSFVKDRGKIIKLYRKTISWDDDIDFALATINFDVTIRPSSSWELTHALLINFRVWEYTPQPPNQWNDIKATAQYILPLLRPVLKRFCVNPTGIDWPEFAIYRCDTYGVSNLPGALALLNISEGSRISLGFRQSRCVAQLGLTQDDLTVDVSKLEKFIDELATKMEVENQS